MPLNVRGFCASAFGASLIFACQAFVVFGQTITPAPTPALPAAVQPPTSGDVMRERISKAKAYIAVRNYNAAIYELENIRKESADTAVQSVTSVLLMNSYLELGDYKRAQDFLNQFYAQQKTNKPNAAEGYAAVAGQVVKGARTRVERYRALGLNVGDRTLPLEALNDLERMRETLEMVITQSREISQTPAKTAQALALLEEATSSRSMLARDDYDARLWKEQVADLREQMAVNGKVVLSAVTETSPAAPTLEFVATNASANTNANPNTNTDRTQQPPPSISSKPADAKQTRPREAEIKPAETTVAKLDKPVPVTVQAPGRDEPKRPVESPKTEIAKNDAPKTDASKTDESKDEGPIDAGSLLPYATKQLKPVYPPAARTLGTKGIVRVDVTVDETGEVSEVQKTSGPAMLQSAAKDAIKKWKFKPFVRDGQPVKATGYVSFNFTP